ncbi:MAG: TIGR00266 family protein [Rhodopirellula sp. JB044]|uniref:TIGR00266 family protein n=1 Tax=Rhodopirellula sp. JB044 TaxID=3342844 RepID=UPI00370B2E57
MIEITCPNCQKRYRLADKFAGKKAKCKKCGAVLVIKPPVAPPDHAGPSQPAKPNPKRTKRASAAESNRSTMQAPQVPAVDPVSVDPAPVEATPIETAEAIPVADAVPTAEAVPIVEAIPVSADPFDDIPVAEPVTPSIQAFADPAFDAGFDAPATAMPISPAKTPSRGRTAASGVSETLRGTTAHMKYEISQRPDFSIVKINLPQGGKVYAEPSAMVSMTPTMHLEAGLKGGLGKTFGRLLGGESLIINTFTAQDGPGEVMFAGGAAGDVAYHRLNGNTLYLQRGAFMFNSEGVEVSGKWQGAKGFFSGEGLVLLKASGTGDIFFNSYGAIIPIDVNEGFMVDTGYIVAFEETLQYRVTVLPGLRAAGKVKSFFFGGEGLVCQFSGTGRVWIQTRQVKSFLSWVNAFRPTKSN